jgi:hypothetical protein
MNEYLEKVVLPKIIKIFEAHSVFVDRCTVGKNLKFLNSRYQEGYATLPYLTQVFLTTDSCGASIVEVLYETLSPSAREIYEVTSYLSKYEPLFDREGVAPYTLLTTERKDLDGILPLRLRGRWRFLGEEALFLLRHEIHINHC